MKTIIAGTRNSLLMEELLPTLLRDFDDWEITEVVSGHSGNVDLAGEVWAKDNDIPVKLFPANWKLRGKSAGPFRNRQMASYADALIAIWDGKSRGTANMIEEAYRLNRKVFIFRL